MKKIFPYILISAGSLLAVSCHHELDTYQGENGIYFDSEQLGALTLTDTIDVSWGMKNSSITSQDIVLNVRLLGNTSTEDRAFDIVIEEAPTYVPNKPSSDKDDNNDDAGEDNPEEGGGSEQPTVTVVPTEPAAAGVDYVIERTTYVMPAGKAEVGIPVTLKRRDDLHLTKRSFKIRLIENPSLKFLYSRALADYDEEGETYMRPIDYQRVIRMSEEFPIPKWWPVRGEPYFGTWSQKKATLICDHFGIDRERWLNDEIQAGRLRFYGLEMQKWLNENPQYEDDGTLMEMGYLSQV